MSTKLSKKPINVSNRRSLPLSKKPINVSNRRSLPLPEKSRRTPTPVKFTKHANKMIDIKSLLSKLPDDLRSRITKKAILEKTVQQKDMYNKDNDNVILNKNISLKDIIETFELDYFNYNDKNHYKDAEKKIIIKDNETVLADIASIIAEEPDSLPVTHIYCYKKIKLYSSDKYEIIFAHIPLNDINANNKEEYIRKTFSEDEINSIDFNQPQLHIRERTIKINNEYCIKDEHYNEIIKKLKYKDLINIFNPEIEDYSKVVNKLKELSLNSKSSIRLTGGKKRIIKKTRKST